WLCLRMRHVSMLLSGAIPALSGLRYPLARTGKRRYNHFVPSQRADSPRQGETEEVFLCCAREKSRSRSLTACTIRRRPGSSRLPTALPASSASYTATTTSMPKACWVCS
ncbi:HTH-type transcriptional regulator sinR, partial [Dysosmobacter welbionis]